MKTSIMKTLLFFMISCSTTMLSCSKQDFPGPNNPENPKLLISLSSTSKIPYSGGCVTAYIQSNCAWSISRDNIVMNVGGTGYKDGNQYVNLSAYSGYGDSQITVDITSIEFASDVSYGIYVSYGDGKSTYISIWQSKNPNGTGGNTGGGNTGGGNTGKPSAPSYVYVDNYGSATIPDIRVSWGSVAGATGYRVYRSTSANGSYSLRGNTANTYYSDSGCKIGNVYYYKVKAYNSAGESDYSNYAEFNFKDNRKPGPAKYGNCTVSGTTMTIRWSVPTDASYGKPTKALLRVKNPNSDQYATIQELSGTATSASFSYLPWVNSSGFIYVGIILENENGTGGGTPKIYDNKNKKWMN